jgi:hypothetical protein
MSHCQIIHARIRYLLRWLEQALSCPLEGVRSDAAQAVVKLLSDTASDSLYDWAVNLCYTGTVCC